MENSGIRDGDDYIRKALDIDIYFMYNHRKNTIERRFI